MVCEQAWVNDENGYFLMGRSWEAAVRYNKYFFAILKSN